MIELRQAEQTDIIELAECAVDESIQADKDYVNFWAQMNIETGPAIAAEYEGELIAVAGVRIERKGVGTLWIIIKEKVEHPSYGLMRKCEALEVIKRMLSILIETFELKKIRATSRIGFSRSQKLLEFLDFERIRRTINGHYIYLMRC